MEAVVGSPPKLEMISPQQLARTDRLLFDFCLTHGRHVYEAESPVAAILGPTEATAMLRAARLLYRVLCRPDGAWTVPEFPLRAASLALSGRVTPPFWARFDGFVRQGGGIFFAELNLDRPGGHRETMISPPRGARFRSRLLRAWRRHWRAYGTGAERPSVAFLVDPAHREELHIAYFYAGLMQEIGWPCVVVGPRNLSVQSEQVLAFDRTVDLIARQFPTEFAHEVPAFQEILRLHRANKVLLLNDPSAVLGQCKSSFAWLWEQVLAGGGALSRPEVDAVCQTVPFTAVMTHPTLPIDPHHPTGDVASTPLALLDSPQHWVLKPVLGRYSAGVTIGALVSPHEWGAAVAAAWASPAYWVAQQYIPPLATPLVRWQNGHQVSVSGYVNWGLHLLDGQFAGWMARCSQTPVTNDAWFAAVSVPPRHQ